MPRQTTRAKGRCPCICSHSRRIRPLGQPPYQTAGSASISDRWVSRHIRPLGQPPPYQTAGSAAISDRRVSCHIGPLGQLPCRAAGSTAAWARGAAPASAAATNRAQKGTTPAFARNAAVSGRRVFRRTGDYEGELPLPPLVQLN